MGLDAVELIMGVEETFHISLADDELEKTQTAGALRDLIIQKVKTSNASTCLSMAAFNIIRRALISSCGVSRRAVRPESKLFEMLGTTQFRQVWSTLANTTGLRLKPLSLSKKLNAVAGLLISLVLLATIAGAFLARLEAPYIIAVTVLLPMLFAVILFVLLYPFADALPKGFATVSDLANDAAARNYTELSKRVGAVNEREVWSILCTVISEQLGIDREKITPESRFVGDLLP